MESLDTEYTDLLPLFLKKKCLFAANASLLEPDPQKLQENIQKAFDKARLDIVTLMQDRRAPIFSIPFSISQEQLFSFEQISALR